MPASLSLSPDELLTTTRAVRKRLDFERPVALETVRECIEIATQAPTGSNAQGWHFVVVTDPAKKDVLGEIYRKGFSIYRDMPFAAHQVHADDPAMAEVQGRVVSSAEYLAENVQRAPVLVIPCVEGRVEAVPGEMATLAQASTYGSILPALWSFMLAARARRLGTCWTTIHLWHEKEAADVLGIPYSDVTQCALTPVAYYTGETFKPGPRRPLDPILHLEGW